jgi:peroxiredoxin
LHGPERGGDADDNIESVKASLRGLLPILVLSLLAACESGASSPKPGALARCEPRGLITVGEKLPDCSFRDFDGSTLTLASLAGTPSILNFWASWCSACIKEMPDFDAVARELDGKVRLIGFNLLGVDGEIESAARSFAKNRGVRYDLAFDPGGSLYAHFSANTALPTTVFVDASGIVRHRQFGELDAKGLRDAVAKHLRV